ncbi:arylsulfatase [Mariniblastus fucicola]|uniref:Arylsulfatase n=1 Tax=Mariniblastus fucicola TaxID=980251 RepID=A0A5B9PF48_9BACT|nr:arylsulfatase [Mariniblastus fucicola]QEG24884.1 Arylsulfatase [Mariniblastus fucicola]
MQCFSLLLCLFVALFCELKDCIALDGPGSPERKPNVILIMTDDMGYGDVGINGNTMLKTPHLDTLAKQSVRMTDFHVDPTCAETRAALMTGRYSCRTGVWHTIMGRSILRADELTMADVFASNGYATGIFGKWHLGDNYPFLPRHRGFQVEFIHGGGGVSQTPDAWGNDYFDDTYFRNGKPEKQKGYCTDVFFEATLDFIEDNRDKPFFAYLATNAAHGPYRCAKEYSQPYRDKGVEKTMSSFYGMITNIDDNVGKLCEKLNELGLKENTILIFTSDNGTARGMLKPDAIKKGYEWIGFNGGLSGTKASKLEGGHRVPFFVRWPDGKIGGGKELSTLTAQFDLLPTFVDLCELKMPREVEFDGSSLKELWLDPDGGSDLNDRTLVVHSQRIDKPEKWRSSSVMKQNWRLINGKYLYDLDSDRAQKKDVSRKYPEVVKELRSSYDKWWKSVSKQFDEYVRIPLGTDADPNVLLTCHDWHVTEGEVPWNQGKIKRDLSSNGFWAVDVRQAGKYKITLRARPAGVDYEFKAGKAKVKVGDLETETDIMDKSDSISLSMKLPVGPTLVQTWISEGKKNRGAYYVEVKRLDQ